MYYEMFDLKLFTPHPDFGCYVEYVQRRKRHRKRRNRQYGR